MNVLGAGVTTSRPDWVPQAVAAAIATLGAVRIYLLGECLKAIEREVAFNIISSAAAVMAATVTWNVLPAPMVALAWAGLALVLAEFGTAAGIPFLRAEAYAMNLAACGRLFVANFTGTGMTGFVSHRVLTVAPVIGLEYYLRSRVRCLSKWDDQAGRGLLYLGAILAAVLLRFELGRVLVVDGWAVLGALLLWLGVRYGNRDLRLQSYALALVSFWRAWSTNFYAPEMYAGMKARVVTGAIVIAGYYFSQYVEKRDSKPRLMFSMLGTVLSAILLYYEVSGRLLTVAWGLEGAVLLAAGFPVRERSLRLSGLALLLVCILKLFLFDLRQLETPYRILSFIVLGVLMLAVSWVYTQFRERIQRFL